MVQKSNLYHVEGQWDLTKQVKYFNLLIGGDASVYEIIPDGNNFVDFKRPIGERNKPLTDGSFGNNIYYKKFGGFAQVTKTFFNEKLKLWGSLRLIIILNLQQSLRHVWQLCTLLKKNIISGLLFNRVIVFLLCLKPYLM